MPLTLRLAGCWLLWAAWCSLAGWGLSAASQLSGWGHLALLPVLVAAVWFWLKSTGNPAGSSRDNPLNFTKLKRRFSRPLPLIYLSIAVLSLLAGLMDDKPWSADAVGYRLPRVLDWWAAHHWEWIGALDHRRDFSSTGFEWQMLPVIELTHTDRFIFLLSWIPFVLFPGLLFLVFRALGVSGRSARRWMWLLPSGYVYALQCSGLQNDGYSVDYLLAAIAFAVSAFRLRSLAGLGLSMIGAALLTGAKLSNLPLLLPLGVLLWPAFKRVAWLNWRLVAAGLVALFVSFAPMSFLSWHQTGDWTGAPQDQWHVKTHGSVGAIAANLMLMANDTIQPPLFPINQRVNDALKKVNDSAFFDRLSESHRRFSGLRFGKMVYEGSAGPGFGLGIYVGFLLFGAWLVKTKSCFFQSPPNLLPWEWRLAPWLAWFAIAVFLAKLGTGHPARIAAAYYPLLLVALLRWPRVAALERKKIAGVLAAFAAATVIPLIILTPARPLIPIDTIAKITSNQTIHKIAENYHVWDMARDNLAPFRDKLLSIPGTARLGYAGGLFDSPYGLWKPLGSRVIVKLGLPAGPPDPLPPADLKYAVITERGINERYGCSLAAWLAAVNGQIIYQYSCNKALTADSVPSYETWYLVKLYVFEKDRSVPAH